MKKPSLDASTYEKLLWLWRDSTYEEIMWQWAYEIDYDKKEYQRNKTR